VTLYEMIDKRRSVRKYIDALPDDDTVDKIERFIENTRQLPGQNAWFEIVPSQSVSAAVGAYGILAYCEAGDAAYANVGYVLQKTDLYIQSLGLGSLWLGMGKPKAKDKRDDFCILLAFGKTDVPLRNGASDFQRLPIERISNEDNAIARSARLAPSAQNSQPWELRFEEDKVIVRYVGRGMFKRMLKKKLNKIDLGIVTRHVALALRNEGKDVRSVTAKSDADGFGIEVRWRAARDKT
jgi:nitroreductase